MKRRSRANTTAPLSAAGLRTRRADPVCDRANAASCAVGTETHRAKAVRRRRPKWVTVSMRVFETPVGWMALAATARGLARLVLPGSPRHGKPPARPGDDAPADVLADRLAPATGSPRHGRGITRRAEAIALKAEREVREYLDGRRRTFTVPVDLEGVPPFRRRVLRAALRIPYGRTVSYAELARRAGSPRGARAVGQAMATNPVPLVIPCHRVLATGGGLGGYGGGLDLKRYLLALEGVQLRNGTEKTA